MADEKAIVPADDKGGERQDGKDATLPEGDKEKGSDKEPGKDKEPEKDKEPALVPSSRLKEEADARRAAEAKVAELEKANTERETKNKEKQGKFEELYNTEKSEKEKLQEQIAVIPQYEAILTTYLEEKLTAMQTAVGSPDKFKKFSEYLGFDAMTPLQKLETLPKLQSLVDEFKGSSENKGSGGDALKGDTDKFAEAQKAGNFDAMVAAVVAPK